MYGVLYRRYFLSGKAWLKFLFLYEHLNDMLIRKNDNTLMRSLDLDSIAGAVSFDEDIIKVIKAHNYDGMLIRINKM